MAERTSGASYSDLVSHSLVGAFHTRLDGQILHVNEALARMCDHETVEGMVSEGALPLWADQEQRRLWVAALREHGSVANFVAEVVTHVGRHIHVIFSATLVGDDITGIVMDITESKRAEEQLRAYQGRLRALATELALTEENERRRIAAELHDGPAQSLALARITLASVRKRAADTQQAEILEDVSQILLQSLRQIRSVMLDLDASSMKEAGLSATISDWLDEQVRVRHGLETSLIDECGDGLPLADNVAAVLFRNTRELLVNAVKHANANRVSVRMSSAGSALRITVEDDGDGFRSPVEAHVSGEGGFGLFSVRESMAEVGGFLEVASRPGEGCRATLVMPLEAGEAGA